MTELSTYLESAPIESEAAGRSAPALAPFARAYAQALIALRSARLSKLGRSSVAVQERPEAGRAQLRFRRYPTLPWEPCGPEVGMELAPALELAAEDIRASWEAA